jgi:hypothetical protein
MSIAQTFTVTVQSTGSGNKYFIDGVQQDTIMIGAGLTYKFDQSDSSNSSHPLRFATAEDAAGSSQYTTGVTASGTPGDAGAYTQIEVAAGAPSTLYYYCTNHSGMGGQANTDGWGRSYWSQADWGDTNIIETGWGRRTWNYQSWGDTPIVELTGLSATTAIGTPTISTEVNVGWGQDEWGVENWGQSGLTVELTAPSEITASLPDTSWGAQGWGSSNANGDVGVTWGGNFILTPADVMGLSGVSSTASVGSIDPVIDFTGTLSGLAATSSVGSVTANENADMLVGLTGQASTSAVGAITPADVVGLTGVSATVSLGTITTNAEDLINVTGVGATSSVGSLTLEIGVPLTGVSATASVGTISPADVMGLTGQEAVSSVGNVSPLGYLDIDITGNTSYNDIDITGNTSYTDVA